MIQTFVKSNSALLKAIGNRIMGYLRWEDYVLLFPRVDYSTDFLGQWIPQLYIIRPLIPPATATSQNSTATPMISSLNRSVDYDHYNIYKEPRSAAITKGMLASIEDTVLEMFLIKNKFSFPKANLNVTSVQEKLIARIEQNVPFTVFGLTIGFYELALLTNVVFSPTRFRNQLYITLNIREMKVFDIVEHARKRAGDVAEDKGTERVKDTDVRIEIPTVAAPGA